LTIVFKSNGGAVRGTVEKCGSGKVVLVPQEHPGRIVRSAACDEAGRYQISALRPGAYYATVIGAEWFTPDLSDEDFLRTATHVTVRAGETTQVDLSLGSVR
jgi:hypothetical protein